MWHTVVLGAQLGNQALAEQMDTQRPLAGVLNAPVMRQLSRR